MAKGTENKYGLVNIDGKAVEKLIETVSVGVGVLYKPRQIRKEADAEAYKVEVMAEAEAKASIIKAGAESEIAERARQRLYHQEIERQINLDNVVATAAENIKEEVSGTPVDRDWSNRFFDKAQDVSSEELQKLWGKILANEVNKPGSVSVRTLDVLSSLSKQEAVLFKTLSGLSTEDGIIIKVNGLDLSAYGLSYDELLSLRAAGLLVHSDNLTVTIPTLKSIKAHWPSTAILRFKPGRIVRITKYFELGLKFEQFGLTPAGKELLKIIGNNADKQYLADLVVWLKTKGYQTSIGTFEELNKELGRLG